FQVQIGEQRSSGTEFDFAGEILPGWNIIANYANTNARISQDNEIEVGTRLINSPRNSASLWTTYQLQEGALEGLGFGLGVYFVGIRNGELRRPFEVPAYTRTDASLFYEKNSFRTQVNFENLFNTRYIEGARDQFRVQPGAPFGVSASVNWEF
ncbi:MAG: TonB-dependent receptor, partial [Cyanobacteria bacterium J06635_11]